MEELIPLLKRIADSFEEQNQRNASFLTLQKIWHDMGDPLTLQIIAIHEENAAKEQAWRDLNTQAIHQFLEEQRQLIKKGLSKE